MLTEVSRSGYYDGLARTDSVFLRKERDYADYLLLKRVHDRHKGKICYRGLYMEMLDLIGGPMNHKRILRIVRKFRIVTKIRRQNAYHTIAKATCEHKTVPNHLTVGSISRSLVRYSFRTSLIYELDLPNFLSLLRGGYRYS
ncbi:IS3 family transposase [Exiguobacterium sp. R-39]|uniref:IS3 family transposase n=1 Tax=Exiguobacterium sp. R-39 TaxID=3416708 RepID=UPI003CF2CD44